MDKKNKGLADNQDGDFILNESGTSVENPWDAGESKENQLPGEKMKDGEKSSTEQTNTPADKE